MARFMTRVQSYRSSHPFRNSSQMRQNEISHLPNNATDRAILAVLFSGIGLALFQLLSNRSLWLDEAMLAISIVHRDFFGLLQPLELNQVAPILFLQLEKIFFLALPHSDLALRIFPLTAWLLSVILFSRIARSMLPGRYAIFAVTLVVFNPTLLRYSGEVKQYSSDVLLATSIAVPLSCLHRSGPAIPVGTGWSTGCFCPTSRLSSCFAARCSCSLNSVPPNKEEHGAG